MAKEDIFDLYRIPSNRILQNRREFYGVRRKFGETTKTWFHRLRICIDRCEFPKFVEYLLMDKFICELGINEMDFYRVADHWTIELLNCAADQEIPTGQMNAVLIIEKYIEPIQPEFSIDRVKPSPPDEDTKEYIRYIPSNETPSGGCSNNEEDDDVSSVASVQSDIEDKSLLRLENSGLDQMMPNDVMECETGEYQYSAYEPATGTFIKLESPVESTISVAMLNDNRQNLELGPVNAELTSNCEKRLKANQKQPTDAIPNNNEHYQLERSPETLQKVSIKRKIARNQDRINEDVDFKSSIANKQKRNSTICNESEKCFKKPSHRKIHKRTHTGKKSFHCDECDISFTQRYRLQQHMCKHTEERLYACDECDKSFKSSRNLTSHKNFVHSKNWKYFCKECDRGFLIPSKLKDHSRIHTGKKSYACAQCNKSFTNRDYLAMHEKRVHHGVRSHVCEKCNRSFFDTSALKRHLRGHTGERPYACDKCDKSFSRMNILKKHKLIKHGSLFECDLCGSTFISKTKLEHHLRKHMEHTDTDDRHSCDLCKKSFAHSSDLYKHKKFFHQGIRTHTCKVCDRSFICSSNLKVHLRTHTGERPFACDQCDRSFVTLQNKECHKMTQHQGPYVCDLCGHAFDHKLKLKHHLHKHFCNNSTTCYECTKSHFTS